MTWCRAEPAWANLGVLIQHSSLYPAEFIFCCHVIKLKGKRVLFLFSERGCSKTHYEAFTVFFFLLLLFHNETFTLAWIDETWWDQRKGSMTSVRGV